LSAIIVDQKTRLSRSLPHGCHYNFGHYRQNRLLAAQLSWFPGLNPNGNIKRGLVEVNGIDLPPPSQQSRVTSKVYKI
jgi:hypothetical protein